MKNLSTIILIVMLFGVPLLTHAHVVVKPSQVAPGAFQTFTIGVPVEKDNATTGVRLVIPAGLKHVTPNVKPGWRINLIKSGEGEEATVNEIEWAGGSIPPGHRDEFLFSAQAPAEAGELQWRAYQTYQDGSVVGWDQDPAAQEGSNDFSRVGPYSRTQISETGAGTALSSHRDKKSFDVSVVALLVAIAALAMSLRKK
jgi:uncharacterized protein YcnI